MISKGKDKEEIKKKREVSAEKKDSSNRGGHTIRIHVEFYKEVVLDAALYRSVLDDYYMQYPEVFPPNFGEGYKLHDMIKTKKQKLLIRRIKLRDGSVYEVVPSDYMPYLIGKTEDLDKGLYLRKWGVPYEAIAYVLGRNASYWERAEASLGRISIVGSLHKTGKLPEHLASDEKISYWNGKEIYIAMTGSKDCVLGAEISMSEDTVGLKAAYSVFKQEALSVEESYNPLSINLDGWKATNQAWLQIFPSIKIILCYLHAFLKIRDIGKGLKERFYEVGTEVWTAYREKTKQGFVAALVNLNTWTQTHFADNLKICQKVGDLCAKAERFTPAYDFEDCYRTSNQIDRPMNAIDRYLYQMRYFKGHRESANNKIRAWAILYNFAPFSERVQKRKENPKKCTRFEQYNGFVYHKNWLHNLLIAASLNAHKAAT